MGQADSKAGAAKKAGSGIWLRMLKKIVDKGIDVAVDEVPFGKEVAGVIIHFIVDELWPQEEEVSVWDQIQENVSELVDKKILDHEMNEIKNELQGLRLSMKQYADAKRNEKRDFLTVLMDKCNGLMQKTLFSKNAHHLLPITISVAVCHCVILQERLVHGKRLWGEDNSVVWKREFHDRLDDYRKRMVTLYMTWSSWRKEQIEIAWSDGAYYASATIHDKCSGKRVQKQNYPAGQVLRLRDGVMGMKDLWFSVDNVVMCSALSPLFVLHRLIPAEAHAAPWGQDKPFAAFTMGPLAYQTVGEFITPPLYYYDWSNAADEVGDIQFINIASWNSVDSVQFDYKDTVGKRVGGNGGAKQRLDVTHGQSVNGYKLGFNNGGVVWLQFRILDRDGHERWTDKFGDKGKWETTNTCFEAVSNYKVYGWVGQEGGASGLTTLERCKFKFRFHDDRSATHGECSLM